MEGSMASVTIELKRLINSSVLKQSAVYLTADVINKMVAFFMLPFLTRFLSPSDYGLVSTFTAYVAVLSVFTGVKTNAAVGVFFFKVDRKALKDHITSAMLILLLTSSAAFVVTYALTGLLARYVTIPPLWLNIALLIAAGQFITNLNLVLWQAQGKSVSFAAYQVGQTIVYSTLSILFLVAYGMKWEGQLLAVAISTISFAVFSAGLMYKRYHLKPGINRGSIKELLEFGVPLVPHDLAGWVKTGADRILITMLVGASATGVYSVGYQIGMIIGIVATAFNRAFSPYLFNKLNDISMVEKKQLVKYTYLYFMLIIIFALMLGAFSPVIFTFFLGKRFQGSIYMVIWVALGYAFDGMYYMVVNYIFYQGRTRLLSTITVTTSVLHVILTYTFVTQFREIGAAYATTISFAATFLLTWVLSARVYSMPWLGTKT